MSGQAAFNQWLTTIMPHRPHLSKPVRSKNSNVFFHKRLHPILPMFLVLHSLLL